MEPAREGRPAERETKQQGAEAKEANAREGEFTPTKGVGCPKTRQRGAEAKEANAREGKFPPTKGAGYPKTNVALIPSGVARVARSSAEDLGGRVPHGSPLGGSPSGG